MNKYNLRMVCSLYIYFFPTDLYPVPCFELEKRNWKLSTVKPEVDLHQWKWFKWKTERKGKKVNTHDKGVTYWSEL